MTGCPLARSSARDALKHAHVLPVRSWKLEERRSSSEPRQDWRTRIGGEHEPWLSVRESLEPHYGVFERQVATEIECRVEESRVACDDALTHRDSMKRCPRVYPKSDRDVYGVAGGEPPFCELQSFFEGARSFARSAY